MSYTLTLPDTVDAIEQQKDEIVWQLVALPPETDMADGPLFRALVKGIGIDYRDPKLYGDLFWSALGVTEETEPSERKATFLIEIVNGWRRQPGLWDMHRVADMLSLAFTAAEELPSSDRRDRLEGLAHYHAALMARMSGQYTHAARHQHMSALLEIKAGNMAKAAISLFDETVERTFDAFGGKNKKTLRFELQAMRGAFDAVGDLLDEGGDGWQTQAGIHLLAAHWLADAMHDLPDADDLRERVLASENTSPFWKDTLNTLHLYDQEKWREVLDAAASTEAEHGDTPSSSIADAIRLCRLASAFALEKLGQREEAILTLGETMGYAEHHGGYFVWSVALQKLTDMKRPS